MHSPVQKNASRTFAVASILSPHLKTGHWTSKKAMGIISLVLERVMTQPLSWEEEEFHMPWVEAFI
jgi:hypothetical protein